MKSLVGYQHVQFFKFTSQVTIRFEIVPKILGILNHCHHCCIWWTIYSFPLKFFKKIHIRTWSNV